MADRRLDALLEERARATSVPARPGVRRLEVTAREGVSQPSQPAPGDRQQMVVQTPGKVPDALSDPRAEALGLGAHKMRFGILLAFCSKHLAVENLSKVYLDLFLVATIREQLMKSLLVPEGGDRFLHHLG